MTSLMYWGFVAKNIILEFQNTTSKRLNKTLNHLFHNGHYTTIEEQHVYFCDVFYNQMNTM